MVMQLPKWVQTESELTIDQSLGRVVDGVPNCLKAAREEIKAGADFLKVGDFRFHRQDYHKLMDIRHRSWSVAE